MTSLSYCAFENTAADMRQCLNMLSEFQMETDGTLEEFIETRSSDYERRAVRDLIASCKEFFETAESMAQF